MKYTFHDWIDNKFVREPYPGGTFVFNDSEKYSYLCAVGKMDYEVLDEIRNAQAEGYERMVCNEFDYRKDLYDEKSSLRTEDVKKLILEDLEIYFNARRDIYRAIITNRPIGGGCVPIGAKFVTAKLTLQPFKIPSLEGLTTNAKDDPFYNPDLMFDGEIDFVIMEAHLRLKDQLEGRIVGKRFPFHYFTKASKLYYLQFLEDQLIRFEGKVSRGLNGEYVWSGTNYECAAFIHFLFESQILSKRHEQEAKSDLEKRYSLDLTQQKPNKVRAYMQTDKGQEFTQTLNDILKKIPKKV